MRRAASAVAAALAVAAVLVAAAAPAARHRPGPAPAAAAERCPGHPAPAHPVPGLRPRPGVPGSLGADPATVSAVLRTGWAALEREDGPGAPLDPRTARVRLAERSGDGIVGVVAAHGSGPEARYGRDAVVEGPDLGHLRGRVAREAYEGAGDPLVTGGAIRLPVTGCNDVRGLA